MSIRVPRSQRVGGGDMDDVFGRTFSNMCIAQAAIIRGAE